LPSQPNPSSSPKKFPPSRMAPQHNKKVWHSQTLPPIHFFTLCEQGRTVALNHWKYLVVPTLWVSTSFSCRHFVYAYYGPRYSHLYQGSLEIVLPIKPKGGDWKRMTISKRDPLLHFGGCGFWSLLMAEVMAGNQRCKGRALIPKLKIGNIIDN